VATDPDSAAEELRRARSKISPEDAAKAREDASKAMEREDRERVKKAS